MGETAKILCPDKKVIVPDLKAGCSLANSCDPEEFRRFIEANPGYTVVSYVNTSAAVKASPYYKERVEKIEKEILAITNNATYTVFSGDDAAYLLTLLNDRKWLLDAMFVVTPEEFARMNEVNERLRELTHELHHQVADAHEKAKRAFLGKEFTVEATLKFVSIPYG